MVARLYPAKAILATVCPYKGVDEQVVARMASSIKDSGYRSILYRSDQEPSIRAMTEEAFKASGREGAHYNADLHQMVPEASAVGESQSDSKAESFVQKMKINLELTSLRLKQILVPGFLWTIPYLLG